MENQQGIFVIYLREELKREERLDKIEEYKNFCARVTKPERTENSYINTICQKSVFV